MDVFGQLLETRIIEEVAKVKVELETEVRVRFGLTNGFTIYCSPCQCRKQAAESAARVAAAEKTAAASMAKFRTLASALRVPFRLEHGPNCVNKG